MMLTDEPIIGGGPPTATIEAARIYLRTAPNRLLTGDEASQIVNAFVHWGGLVGVRWDVAFAQSCHETNLYRFGNQVALVQHNPAGIGATNDGAPGLAYADWRTGIAAYFVHLLGWCNRLELAPAINLDYRKLDPRLPLVAIARADKGKATTWASLGGRWAVPGVGYGAAIERHHAAIVTIGQEQPSMAPKIALAAGHKNSSGGDEFEKQQTGPLCAAVARHCRALGMDVRVVQPDDGMGTIAGSLDVVGNTVVGWAKAGWTPDIFLECHTEGGGGLGVFAIYPDWQGDVDADVRDTLGPIAATAIAQMTGLRVGAGGDGVMSEKQTGVGASGSRLGIFRTTAPLAATTTRLIIEYGAHDREPDLSIAKGAHFADRCGRATAGAFAEFLHWTPPLTATSTGATPPAEDKVTWQTVLRNGRTILEIDFGGQATEVVAANLVDVGVTVRNRNSESYSRSVQENVAGRWIKHS